MRARCFAPVALSLALAPAAAHAAPMGSGAPAAAVLAVEADLGNEVAAKSLTNALRQRVLDSEEFTLNAQSPPLVATAYEVKCPLKGLKRPVVETNERVFDAACLRRVGEHVRAKNFFWGLVYDDGGGRPVVRMHLWREGGADRAATLPYDPGARERIADRLYRKLVTPELVGDLALVGDASGELVVDGQPQGAYASGVELTLFAGEHEVEVRRGDRAVAHVRAKVEARGRVEARLKPVAEPVPTAPPTPPGLPNDPPSVAVRRRASALPWVLGGAAGAGLAGAGVFWVLRQGEASGLRGTCEGGVCPDRERDAVERGRIFTALAGASLGVGLAAGASLGAYLLAPRRPPAVSGAVVPLPGGAAAGVGGSF